MARERVAYQGGLVGAIDIPNVGADQFTAKIDGLSTLQKNINTVLNYSLSKGATRAEGAAVDFVTNNPLSYEDVTVLPPEEKQKIFDAQNTLYGAKVKELRTLGITLDLETAAQAKLQELDTDYQTLYAITGQFDTASFVADATAIVNGYTQALAEFDLGESFKLKSSLSVTANSYVSAAEKQAISDYKAIKIKDTESVVAARQIERLKLFANYGATFEVVGPDGEVIESTTDQLYYREAQKDYEKLLYVGSEQASSFLETIDIQAQDAKKNVIENYYRNQTGTLTETQVFKIGDEFESGEFLGDKNVDLLFNSLDEKTKADIRQSYKEFEKDELQRIEQEEQAVARVAKDNWGELQARFDIAVFDNDDEEAGKIADEMKKFVGGLETYDDDIPTQFRKNTTVLRGWDNITDVTILKELEDLLVYGNLSFERIEEEWKNNNLSKGDYTALEDAFIQQRDDSVEVLKSELALRLNLDYDADQQKAMLGGVNKNRTIVTIIDTIEQRKFQKLVVSINTYILKERKNKKIVTFQEIEEHANEEYKKLNDPATKVKNIQDQRAKIANNVIIENGKDDIATNLGYDKNQEIYMTLNDQEKLGELELWLLNLSTDYNRQSEFGVTQEDVNGLIGEVRILKFLMVETTNE